MEGLTVGETYTFGFYASYKSDNAVRRLSKYTINGDSVTLQPGYNTGTVVYLYNVAPDISGIVVVELDFGADPSVPDKMCDLAVMTIEGNFAAVPEPATLSLLVLGGFLIRRKRA